jgi:hypothetical protein
MNYELSLEIISEGYDRETEWFEPKIAIAPNGKVILTMMRAQLWGSDIFTGLSQLTSTDFGKTWSQPEELNQLGRKVLSDHYEECPCGMTPIYHHASGTFIMTGGTCCYFSGEQGPIDMIHARHVTYSYFDKLTQSWTGYKNLKLPDKYKESFYWAIAECSQQVELPSGDLLIPIYVMSQSDKGDDFWKGCFRSVVLRCRFDGETLRYIEQGNELVVPDPRGMCEPSLTKFKDYYYLTIRNDIRAYVARSKDGLHFDTPIPWQFDDGTELGSYNTQQHWITHKEALFLTYTRRGADNDHVVRNRAPLFIAEVDTENMCLIRETERIIIPDNGAQLGNFGCFDASENESWLVAAEGMQGDAKDCMNLSLTEKRGANNRVYLARIKWDHQSSKLSKKPQKKSLEQLQKCEKIMELV